MWCKRQRAEDTTDASSYDCNGTGAQKFDAKRGPTQIKVSGKNFCLDAGTDPKSGSKVHLWQCYPGLKQQVSFASAHSLPRKDCGCGGGAVGAACGSCRTLSHSILHPSKHVRSCHRGSMSPTHDTRGGLPSSYAFMR